MMNRFSHIGLTACLAAFVTTAIPASALAAPTMQHDTCRITGIITSLEELEIKRDQPDSWLDSWGLSKKYSEIKIDLDVTSIEILDDLPMDQTSCTLEKAEQGYYFKGNSTLKKLLTDFEIGDCITAETNYSGDEFRIGNWIYDIEALPADNCIKAGHSDIKEE